VKLLRLITAVTGFGLLTSGCYTLQPTSVAVPSSGTRLAFSINDVGRVALGGSMGPELRRVEGNLQSKEGDDYFVNVSGVELLQGGFQTWAGETVRINSSYVSAIYEKKFSKGKTILALAATAAAITLVSSKGVQSFINLRNDNDEQNEQNTKRGRIPRTLFPIPSTSRPSPLSPKH